MSADTPFAEPRLGHLAITTTCRYWLQPATEMGEDGKAPLLVGCHGYAETAQDHLKELRRIPGIARWHVLTPEAPHPFYKGRTGEVVRSWMTKEDRELTIADNVGYLQRLIATTKLELPTTGTLVFSGFSQGAAMAWRGALRCGWPCHGVIVLGGDVPSDAIEPAPLSWPRVLLGHGTEDPWYTAEKFAADHQRLSALGASVETFEGSAGHEWWEGFHDACGRFLATLAA